MYDIKTIEFGQAQQQQHPHPHTRAHTHTHTHPPQPQAKQRPSSPPGPADERPAPPFAVLAPHRLTKAYSTCSVISTGSSCSSSRDESASRCLGPAEATHMTLLSLRRRRIFQRQACLLSILAAFVFGLALGVFLPMFGLSNVFAGLGGDDDGPGGSDARMLPVSGDARPLGAAPLNRSHSAARLPHPPSDFPTIYGLRADGAAPATATAPAPPGAGAAADDAFSVAFIQERPQELPAEEVFRNAFHLEQDKDAPDAMIVKKLDASDGSIKEFRVQRTPDGLFRKGPERRLSKPSLAEQALQGATDGGSGSGDVSLNFVPLAQRIAENARDQRQQGVIKGDIYWGDLVEAALPRGFSAQDASDWNRYVRQGGTVERLEPGCGRMQNRLVVFADGSRACARYRQNTDQIQGELFSFYLGQVLNMSNLAPSAASVIDLESRTWSAAVADITQAQWKRQRPVVLTRWLPDLEPAGIPQPFQPLERHLNKFDVWNITLGALKGQGTDTDPDASNTATEQGLLQRLAAPSAASAAGPTSPVLRRLIELAQWSDLIVFDYLIANLDRVVNNLYNYQWNADIMAAPAHNLARQADSQLLVFLDNESGLLHGYRLLKKYEAYHGLLLDNLCVFRQPTIEALRQLREYGPGRRLRELFEQTTSPELRDVLPSLPDKSVKILVDRIDRVLGQVQKCRDLLADR